MSVYVYSALQPACVDVYTPGGFGLMLFRLILKLHFSPTNAGDDYITVLLAAV